MEMEFERAYVDRFVPGSNNDKLFGFAFIRSDGSEIFLHHANRHRCWPSTEPGKVNIGPMWPDAVEVPSQFLGRYPMDGDNIMVVRTPTDGKVKYKADPWYFQDEYEWARETSKHEVTFEVANSLLANLASCVLEYTNTIGTPGYGTEIETVVEVYWPRPGTTIPIASGKLTQNNGKWTGYIVVHASDMRRKAEFKDEIAASLRHIGTEASQIRKGALVNAMWNGGCDTYIVDPKTVRDATEDEVAAIIANGGQYPTVSGDNGWLRCRFAKNLGGDNQVVKVLSYRGGHD
jgi:hypothetical protein